MGYRIFGKGTICIDHKSTIHDLYNVLLFLKKAGFTALPNPEDISEIRLSFDHDAEEIAKLGDIFSVCDKICGFIDSGEIEFVDNDGTIVRVLFHDGRWKKEKGSVVYSIYDVFTEKQINVLKEALSKYADGNDAKEAYELLKEING